MTDLSDLPTGPVTKLAAAAGGYALAALTAGNDLYVWGDAGRSGAALSGLFSAREGEGPSPVVISSGEEGEGEGKDVADVAVGDAHMVALTTDGEVYVIGDNGSGQLGGLGTRQGMQGSWTRVDLEAEVGIDGRAQSVTGVAAGPMNSFLIVRNRPR